ncbi:porin [Sphingobacterium bovistauri]|uniref:Porin n=1 Tax=Sphingobacterium bovistauri TaxID=2781959 RepID=A0ABS7Z5N2_9SPHI|nr:porin [Sphingobacterium bovistauri]MCA5005505.1 porin [Sphingobacterium bovistauri]
MKKITLLFSLFLSIYVSYSQESVGGIEISGSADAYWKYDFANGENIQTYFANDHNSISLGMLNLAIKKSTGKASFVGEVSFGPRGQYLTIPNGDGTDDNSFHIQNLYVDYAFSDKFSMTAGYMGTFIGLEVISPASNFHYSTSYLFGAGPFQNAGIKGTYAFSDKVSLMAGLFNDWNTYKDLNGVSHFGAQLNLAPIEGLSIYANFLTGTSAGGKDEYSSGTIYDLVASYEVSEKFSVGLNAADYTFKSEGGFQGVALYPKYNITDYAQIGARGEFYKTKDVGSDEGEEITSFTLTGKLSHGGLSFIPEVRFDSNDSMPFLKSDFTTSTKSASQFSLAVVYAF